MKILIIVRSKIITKGNNDADSDDNDGNKNQNNLIVMRMTVI